MHFSALMPSGRLSNEHSASELMVIWTKGLTGLHRRVRYGMVEIIGVDQMRGSPDNPCLI